MQQSNRLEAIKFMVLWGEDGDKRQKTKDKRQKTKDKRQKSKVRMPEDSKTVRQQDCKTARLF